MTRSRQYFIFSGLHSGKIKSCRRYMAGELETLREKLLAKLSAEGSTSMGLKVWVIPPWYHHLLERNRSGRLAIVDFCARSIGRPRLVLVGEIDGIGVPLSLIHI